MSIYGNSMAIRMARECNGEYLVLQTLSKKHKRSVRFYVDADRLAKWLNAESREPFFDEDMGNWLRITPAGNAVVCWCDSNDTYTRQATPMFEVETSLGTLVAKPSADPNYPGISIYLRRGKEGHAALLGAVECSEHDKTLMGVLWFNPDDICYSVAEILTKEQTDRLYEAEA